MLKFNKLQTIVTIIAEDKVTEYFIWQMISTDQ